MPATMTFFHARYNVPRRGAAELMFRHRNDYPVEGCINWVRSLPCVRAWADKYSRQGLAVIGVQTPEFDFENSLDGVPVGRCPVTGVWDPSPPSSRNRAAPSHAPFMRAT
jgi:hypothetical protein